jgi:hypothetical protein
LRSKWHIVEINFSDQTGSRFSCYPIAKLGCVLRTVERKLELIRSLWQEYRDERRHGKQ